VYGKVFASIFDGSLHGKFEATAVMMALIALADKDGAVDMTQEALAARTGFPLDLIERGISQLSQPDPRSRSKDAEGRRIVPIDPERDWGWIMVNHAKYQSIRSNEERREYMREYMAKRRAVNNVNQPLARLAHIDRDTDIDTDTKKRVERASRFALTQLPDEWALFCTERQDLDPAQMFAKFGDYWREVPGAKGRKLDWIGTWRNFIRTERAVPSWAKPPKSSDQVAAEVIRQLEAEGRS
jgi:hypothetical protein